MANIYNPAYVANLAVRNLLSEIGRRKARNRPESSSTDAWIKFINGKAWEEITERFEDKCAYCGTEKNLQKDHLIRHNKEHCGLHHPGNIVPSCASCNNRNSKENKEWDRKLRNICDEKDAKSSFKHRLRKIREHHTEGKYKYPKLSNGEMEALKEAANTLYEKIKKAIETSTPADCRDKKGMRLLRSARNNG